MEKSSKIVDTIETNSSEMPSSEAKTKVSEMKGQREDRTDSGFFSESLTPKLAPEATATPEETSGEVEGQITQRRNFEYSDIPVFASDSESEEHRSSEKVRK